MLAKMDNWKYVLIFIVTIFICSIIQIILKSVANKHYTGFKAYLNAPVIISNIVFVLATMVNVYLMKYIKLSTVSILNLLTYVFVPPLSILFLKEKINARSIAGIIIIVFGMTIYALWGQ
jgi:drug/metabolite transporter (DMT)-like permease